MRWNDAIQDPSLKFLQKKRQGLEAMMRSSDLRRAAGARIKAEREAWAARTVRKVRTDCEI